MMKQQSGEFGLNLIIRFRVINESYSQDYVVKIKE